MADEPRASYKVDRRRVRSAAEAVIYFELQEICKRRSVRDGDAEASAVAEISEVAIQAIQELRAKFEAQGDD